VNSRAFQERLSAQARLAGLEVSTKLSEDLEAYYQLLTRWNRKINLTGLDPADLAPETLDRLLLEPLAAAKHIPADARSLIDIGSGGGSPAVPLALAAGIQLVMVESKVRKSVFLREVLRELKLDGSEVLNERYETLLARHNLLEAFDVLSIRAVRQEPAVLNSLQLFVRGGGTLLLFRRDASMSDQDMTPPLKCLSTHPLIKSLQSQLIVIRKEASPSVPRGTSGNNILA